MIPLEACTSDVLDHYPAWLRGNLVFLGNHGGFSGAHLWRLTTSVGIYCLKAWPSDGRPAAELAWIHGLLEHAQDFPWVPRIVPTLTGSTFVSLHSRLWEIASWMPGRADFSQAPSAARLEAACTALAQLHQAWLPLGVRKGLCPALQRRWDSWEAWMGLLSRGWRPVWNPMDPFTVAAEQLWQLLPQHIDEVPKRLAWRLGRHFPLQPCICDLWHDHVLFQGDEVTGLIDFGSVKQDHVAVDLARLLGSMIGSDEAMWKIGLAAYHRIRRLSLIEEALACDLDRTGTILAATHWLRWLYLDHRNYDRPDAVSKRLANLAQRLKSF